MGVLDYLRPPPHSGDATRAAPALNPASAPAGDALDYLAGRTPADKREPAPPQAALARRYDAKGVWIAPEGRKPTPKRAETILRHYTGNGEELLVWMLLLARGEIGEPRRYVFEDGSSEIRFDGPPPSLQLMADAHKWCADRVFGKAPETVVQITKTLDAEAINLEALSTEQLRALGEILRAPVAPTIDVTPKPADETP